MKFTEHRDSNVFAVKHYQPGLVKVNNLTFYNSFFITQHTTHDDWPCTAIEQLTPQLLDPLLAQKPEVIILGTGDKQTFPAPQLFAYCAQNQCGLEVMANDAACRTYNVLTSEDRDVVLALIMPQNLGAAPIDNREKKKRLLFKQGVNRHFSPLITRF
ncbi:Mth938-like domain-containing protein [Thiomicrorhabdus aquaedulcis]|uniref:Mth938-like domain-containing protein n=1 Tax=Thiomicrorhabdus aquaedulcis TaxID=2211106 RepID=UPI000FD8F102|nr:Mth938-like domain-containing protein [Thiomicrorhabdus aquaedulcis]